MRAALLSAVICILIVLFLAAWPADACWGGDDVSLITAAIGANAQHHLAVVGLAGSFGYPYGPIPTQIYQLLTAISHDPMTLVRLHAALFSIATTLSLFYLSRVLKLSPWLVPLVMVGPFFWFYSRLIWDNTFAIPIGTLLLAAYGDYLRRSSPVAFFTWIGCLIGLPFIHPMTLPLVAAVGIHAFVHQRRQIGKYWKGLIVVAATAAILCGPYVSTIAGEIRQSPGLAKPPDQLSRAAAFSYPLFAPRVFCAQGFFDARGPEVGIETTPALKMAQAVSTVAYPLFWLGLIFCIRQRKPLQLICLTALLLQSVMDGCLQISPYPHYYCGTWAAVVVVIWTGISGIGQLGQNAAAEAAAPVLGIAYGVSLCMATAAFALDIHQHAGGRVWYGPSLGSQIQVANQLSRYINPTVVVEIAGQTDKAAGIKTLVHPGGTIRAEGTLVVRYVDDPLDCHLQITSLRNSR